MTLAIRCTKLEKTYPGGVVAVAGLDLEVRAGECFGLLGPNGAGKTTTVEILEGLLDPSGGTVEILGRPWANNEVWLRQRLGVSLQETSFPERLRVREVIALFRSFFRAGRDVDDMLDLVQLRDKERAWYRTLSGGQKQRLAVACALVGEPKLLFLDEPTTGLDPQSRRMLWDVVLAFKQSGGSVLLTTHYMDEAEKLCDRVGVVDHGKMIALGTPDALIDALGGKQIVELTLGGGGDVAAAAVALGSMSGVASSHARGEHVVLTIAHLHVALPLVLEELRRLALEPTSLSTHRATLEDVFVKLTGRALRD